MKFIAACGLALFFLTNIPAYGQALFPTPGGIVVGSELQMCLNTAGQAVPISSGQCAAGAQVGVLPYPTGATPIVSAASGTTGAVTASLAALAGKSTYLCGFDVSSAGAGPGPVTTTGLTSNFTYQLAAAGTVSRTFTPCIKASAADTAISLATTANASATAVNVNLFGFQF